MSTLAREHAIALALAGAVAAALAWYALASLTGLIFHLMPAGPTLVAASIVRWAEGRSPGGRSVGRSRRAALLVAGASIAVAMSLGLESSGHPLDEPSLTALAVVGGVVIGARLLRSSDADPSRSTS